MQDAKCTYCGGYEMDPGFVGDSGQGARGFTQWFDGRLERGPLGNARRFGRTRSAIEGLACRRCGHIELFRGA